MTKARDISDVANSWTAYTPTLSNITLGNGTIDCSYIKIGKFINVRIQINFGSTSSMGSNPSISIPLQAKNNSVNQPSISNLNVGAWYLGRNFLNVTKVDLYLPSISGANILLTSITSTAPATWGNGSQILTTFTYEAA